MRPVACIVHGGAGNWAAAAREVAVEGCRSAVAAAIQTLLQGGDAVGAVVTAVSVLEDLPQFNAGVGSVTTDAGTVEMDAAVMEGSELRAGAVALVRTVRHPVELAWRVLTAGREVLLAGGAADSWARELGLELVSADTLLHAAREGSDTVSGPGTVGAVACDARGNVAAATSTGGRKGKRPGRIGDSPIVGAGTYADNRGGAASATGDGEAILRFGLTRVAVTVLERGFSPAVVAGETIAEFARRTGSEAGVILVDSFGRFGYAHNTAAMPVAWWAAGEDRVCGVLATNSCSHQQ